MAFITKKGKAYAVVYYIGKGKDRRQVWKSGLSYKDAKAQKRIIENEIENEPAAQTRDITVKAFLLEFIKNMEKRNGWPQPTRAMLA